MFPGGGGGDFVYFFAPGPGFRKSFLPGGREFDYLKKFPGVQPGGRGCWCLELTDALSISYSWWKKDENERETAQDLFVGTEFVSKIRKLFIATRSSDVQNRRWQEEYRVKDKFVFSQVDLGLSQLTCQCTGALYKIISGSMTKTHSVTKEEVKPFSSC